MNAAPEVLDPMDSFDLSEVERRLEARFCPPLRPGQVRCCTAEAAASLASARVRTFVGLLVERTAGDRLRVLAAEASAGANGRRRAVVAAPTRGDAPATPPGRVSPWWLGWWKDRPAGAGRRPARSGAGEEQPRRETSC